MLLTLRLPAAVPPSTEKVDLKLDTKQDKNNTQAVLKILKKHGINKEQLSIAVHELKSNKTVFNHREKEAHIPASVTKLFTTYFALNVLDPKTKFETTLAYTGKIENNTLKGDLFLQGGGDPYLTNEKLLNLVMHLQAKGIYKVEGQFYFDDSLFPFLEKISLVGLEDHTYNSSVSALSSDFNRIRIIRGKKGRFETLPPLTFLEIDETKEKLGPGEKFQRDYLVSINQPKNDPENAIEESLVYERWFGSKKQRYAKVEEIPLRNPAMYTASMFDYYAKKFNIQLPYPKPGTTPIKVTTIAKAYSPNLLELSKLALYYSNNLIAESLLFHAAMKFAKRPISNFIDAARVMENWIKKKFPILDLETLKLQNGSGLSSANVVSADDLTNFLQSIKDSKFLERFYWSILPASAHSGFLRRKFVNNDAGYNIWAKTGSLDYVNNIAGYIFSKNGQQYSFSLMFQDLDGRKVVDGPNSPKAEKFRQKARTWRKKTQNATEAILEYLILNL
jgi:D-alanyl-D-alanine carboxypeptidase/D-alanyl-D-alanine-endopeptidase (penicillin-binding protein 4)